LRIAFLCHPTTAGCWDPNSVHDGIGGSEEAVIHMASLLSERGHRVSVHMRSAPHESFGEVEYGDFHQLLDQDIDVVVVWRRSGLVQELDRQRVCTGRRYLWLHDNVAVDGLLRAEPQFYKIMVLSAYHRRRFPELPDDRFFATPNGIDVAQFDPPDPPRDPWLVVYGSDYVRGLRALLHSWSEIRRRVPDARLNVFYGWQGIQRVDPERAARLQGEFGPLLRQPGISHLRRISHAAVAAQYRRAAIWAYPCSFRETSCISAMKAQAGGAVPAVIPNGALSETVRFGFRTRLDYDGVPKELSGDELVREWREGLIDLLRSPDRQERIRREMVPAAKAAFAWSHVASAWDHEFTSI
jgi:glycosyltransferase involved in cell wall biosynthesis